MSSTPKSVDDILDAEWSRCTKILVDIEDANARGSWVHTTHDHLELAEALYDLQEWLGFADLIRSAQRFGFRLDPDEIETLISTHEALNGLGKYDETQFSRLAA